MRILSVPLLCIFFFACNDGDEQSPYKNFTIQPLARNVWAVIHNDKTGFAICNAGIVDLGDSVLVFDTFINPGAAEELKQAAENLTGKKVSLVVNSHFHDDHIRGNQVFVPGAGIISTGWTKNKILINEPTEQQWAKENIAARQASADEQLRNENGKAKEEAQMWKNYYDAIAQSLPGLTTILPERIFSDTLRIAGPEKELLLVEMKNGHTSSDIVMIIPEDGIVFMGDLLFKDRHPWLGDGDAENWKKHLADMISDVSLREFVPGHGDLNYINDLQQLAAEAVSNQEPDSVFVKRPVPEKYKNWWYGRFFAANLQAVYKKEKGNY
jgi:glyoxylase-like metal-dependent hydrolase (beta-lactamase superfamily II)